MSKKVETPKQEPQMAEIPVSVINAVLEFLGAQPYSKVVKIIDAIQENAKVK